MKVIACILASLIFSTSAYSNSDEYRSAYARSVREHYDPPLDLGSITLTDVFYAKEVRAIAYTYIGEPNRSLVKTNAVTVWRNKDGESLRKLGFKDMIYAYGYKSEEYGLFSVAENKWYSGITAYCIAHGIK